MPICKMCRQVLTGLDSVFNDSGAGVMVLKCPRCHHLSHHLDQVAIDVLSKQASGLGGLKDALVQMGPAIAALGIWDIAVAYNTFKKVMDNTLRMQQKQSPLYSPFWADDKDIDVKSAEKKVLPGDKVRAKITEEHGYPGLEAGKEYVVAQVAEAGGEEGPVILVEGLKDWHLFSLFEKVASLEKKADDWVDNHAYKPHEDIENIVTQPNPMHYEINTKEDINIALSQVQDFLVKVIPHVVAYAVERQDTEVLQALGHLGSIIRDARKAQMRSREEGDQDYSRTYLVNPSADVGSLIM